MKTSLSKDGSAVAARAKVVLRLCVLFASLLGAGSSWFGRLDSWFGRLDTWFCRLDSWFGRLDSWFGRLDSWFGRVDSWGTYLAARDRVVLFLGAYFIFPLFC